MYWNINSLNCVKTIQLILARFNVQFLIVLSLCFWIKNKMKNPPIFCAVLLDWSLDVRSFITKVGWVDDLPHAVVANFSNSCSIIHVKCFMALGQDDTKSIRSCHCICLILLLSLPLVTLEKLGTYSDLEWSSGPLCNQQQFTAIEGDYVTKWLEW